MTEPKPSAPIEPDDVDDPTAIDRALGPNDNGDDDDPPELFGESNKRWGTVGILIVNLAVGVVMAWAGVPVIFPTDSAGLVSFGALEPTHLWAGEVWRLVTACFVHVASWHLGLNLWVLWQVGRALERLMGTARYVLVYLASGIFGFALSTALSPGVTVGASGAIFGVTGALLAIALLTHQRPLGKFLITSLQPFVIGTAALGLLLPFMNNIAHFGGLLMGFVLGYGLNAGDRSFVDGSDADRAVLTAAIEPRERAFGVVALVVSLALFAGIGLYAVEPRYSPRFHALMGLRALHTAATALPADKKTGLDDGRAHADRARALAKDDAGTHVLLARLKESDGDVDGAAQEGARAFALYSADVSDRYAAFDAATAELGLVDGSGDADGMPWSDGYTVRVLCNAALDAGTAPAPLLKNACAWLLLRAREPAVRDPARALGLAREAFRESDQKNGAVAHTYACALAQNGQASEGLAVLERLVVDGDLDGVSPAFINSERARLQQLAAQQAKAAAAAPPVAATPPAMPDAAQNVPTATEVR